MIIPALSARIIERNSFTRKRLSRLNLFAFSFIATPTSATQIEEVCLTTMGNWYDVISCQSLSSNIDARLAVDALPIIRFL